MRTDEAAVGVYASLAQAQAAVQALRDAGIAGHEISLLATDPARNPEVRDAVQQGDKTVTSAATGAGLGGLLGLLVGGAAILTIPGIGPLFIAGAMATGLTGAVVGGILGCMAGWGIPENHIRIYEEKVKEGRVLVIVHGGPRQVAQAERVLVETDPEELHLHVTAADESPEVPDAPVR